MGYLLGLDNLTLNSSKEIYPNPTTDVLYLNNFIGSYKISDMSGRDVYNGISQNEKSHIDVSTLTPGTYLFKSGNYRKIFIKK